MAKFLFPYIILGIFLSSFNCSFADDEDKSQSTEQKSDDKQIDDNANVATQDNDMLGLLSMSIHTNTLNPALALGILNGIN
ncbi:MAG: hypothetical protein LBP31_03665 [Holosporales bacterium]|jgi:hypothetical protein|nr:hypothetical protein [Holosporales bacterium]